MSLEQEAGDGLRAARMMEELAPYLQIVRTAILDKWEKSPVSDKDGQHELRLLIKLLTDLEGNIKTTIETGKLASIQIERDSLLSRTKTIFGRR